MEKSFTTKYSSLLWVGLVILTQMLGACQKEEKMNKYDLQCPVTAKEGTDNNIVGKWKLVKADIKPMLNPRTEDYSCSSVIYHFKEEGLLIVSGVYESIAGYKDNQYSFEFKDTKLYESLEKEYTVKIEDTNIACGIQSNNMILDNSFLDGDILYFVRIE